MIPNQTCYVVVRSACVSTNRNCLQPNTVHSHFPSQFPCSYTVVQTNILYVDGQCNCQAKRLRYPTPLGRDTDLPWSCDPTEQNMYTRNDQDFQNIQPEIQQINGKIFWTYTYHSYNPCPAKVPNDKGYEYGLRSPPYDNGPLMSYQTLSSARGSEYGVGLVWRA